jgi:hypothetical protein
MVFAVRYSTATTICERVLLVRPRNLVGVCPDVATKRNQVVLSRPRLPRWIQEEMMTTLDQLEQTTGAALVVRLEVVDPLDLLLSDLEHLQLTLLTGRSQVE